MITKPTERRDRHIHSKTDITTYRRGVKKNTSFHPHFVDKSGGSAEVDKRDGEVPPMWIFFFHFIILL